MTTLDTKKTLKDKHYETGVLWKTDHRILPMNRNLVCLYSLEGKLKINSVLEQVDKDYRAVYCKWLC